MVEGVRIEWSKSRARASRFAEEVCLLAEEMNRVLRFLKWKAEDWQAKSEAKSWPEESQDSRARAEGHRAYAHRQASISDALSRHFRDLWKDLPAHILRMQEIIADPTLAKPGEFDGTRVRNTS